jgi:hypothetical protein
MKNTNSKQNVVEDGDYRIVGEVLELAPGTVKMIRLGYRADHHNVMKALAIVREHRELSRVQLKKKLIAIKITKHNLNQQAA